MPSFCFFLLHSSESLLLLLLLPLVLSFVSLRENFESSFVPVILYRDSNLSSSELYLVRSSLLLSFLLLRLLVHWSWFLICLGIVWVSCLRLFVECWHLLVLWGFFKGSRCPPVFFVGWGFLVGVESRILEWVHWWCEVF